MIINEVRFCGYWIVGGFFVVVSYILKCVKCRKMRGVVED